MQWCPSEGITFHSSSTVDSETGATVRWSRVMSALEIWDQNKGWLHNKPMIVHCWHGYCCAIEICSLLIPPCAQTTSHKNDTLCIINNTHVCWIYTQSSMSINHQQTTCMLVSKNVHVCNNSTWGDVHIPFSTHVPANNIRTHTCSEIFYNSMW